MSHSLKGTSIYFSYPICLSVYLTYLSVYPSIHPPVYFVITVYFLGLEGLGC